MKLVRYGVKGKEKPGIIDSDGNIRDLSKKVSDIDGKMLSSAKLKQLFGREQKTKYWSTVQAKNRRIVDGSQPLRIITNTNNKNKIQ